MRTVRRAMAALIVVGLALGCGGGTGPVAPSTPVPTPAPTPTPVPAGTIEMRAPSLPEGSTVEVGPMGHFGQQAPDLWFRAIVSLREDLALGYVQAFVRTDEHRCMGGGGGRFVFSAGVAVGVVSSNVSHQSQPLPPCALPYTTTHVEFVVVNQETLEVVLAVRFPAVYNFVAES